MRHHFWIRTLGLSLAGAVFLSMGDRPEIRASQPVGVVSAASIGQSFGGDSVIDDEPKPDVVYVPEKPMSLEATRVWLKLQERVPVQFPDETSLGDFLKYIQENTIDKANLPDGIPIYADPVALQDSDKTMADKIKINLKGIPLATTLKLALHQLSLDYRIHPDGLVYITFTASEETPPNLETQIMNDMNRIELRIIVIQRELMSLRGRALPGQSPPSNPASDAQRARGMGGGFR